MMKVEGIKAITVNFPNKVAYVEFDESVISAQEVSVAAYRSPHMMGKDMQYGTFLLLSVPGAKDKVTGAKATTALNKVTGVGKAVFFPQTKSVSISFTEKGKLKSTELIKALEDVGLMAGQYGFKIKK